MSILYERILGVCRINCQYNSFEILLSEGCSSFKVFTHLQLYARRHQSQYFILSCKLFRQQASASSLAACLCALPGALLKTVAAMSVSCLVLPHWTRKAILSWLSNFAKFACCTAAKWVLCFQSACLRKNSTAHRCRTGRLDPAHLRYKNQHQWCRLPQICLSACLIVDYLSWASHHYPYTSHITRYTFTCTCSCLCGLLILHFICAGQCNHTHQLANMSISTHAANLEHDYQKLPQTNCRLAHPAELQKALRRYQKVSLAADQWLWVNCDKIIENVFMIFSHNNFCDLMPLMPLSCLSMALQCSSD